MDTVVEKLGAFFEAYPLRHYRKGDILIYAGDDSPSIFYIVSGRVRQYDISYRGDEVVVMAYKPGAFFPMMGAITGLPNRYFFAAEIQTAVRVAPREAVLAFVQADPQVAYDLLRRLYSGVDGLLGRIAHLMAGSARSRVLYELLIIARRFGKPLAGGASQVVMTETALAAHAGLSRETVSREVQRLTQEGHLTLNRKGITIHDMAVLERLLGTTL